MSASKIGGNPSWQQSMLRVKDPKKSLDFYQNQLGMTLIDKYDFGKDKGDFGKDKGDFSLFFLASFKAGETYSLTPGSAEAHKYVLPPPHHSLTRLLPLPQPTRSES